MIHFVETFFNLFLLPHWNEKEIEGLLKKGGFRLKWYQKRHLGPITILLSVEKET